MHVTHTLPLSAHLTPRCRPHLIIAEAPSSSIYVDNTRLDTSKSIDTADSNEKCKTQMFDQYWQTNLNDEFQFCLQDHQIKM